MQGEIVKLAGIEDFKRLVTAEANDWAALPMGLSKSEVARVAILAATKTPKLLQCTVPSLRSAFNAACEMGLHCSGASGEGYLIPYRTKSGAYEAQFQPGFQGLVKLVLMSGHVADIQAVVVHEKDEFTYSRNPAPNILHTPHIRSDPGKVVAVYCVAILQSGVRKVEVMRVDEIERVRSSSKARDSEPWRLHWEEMAKKTILKRMCKTLPKSAPLTRLIEHESEFEESAEVRVVENTAGVASGERTQGLADRVSARVEPAAAPPAKPSRRVQKVEAKPTRRDLHTPPSEDEKPDEAQVKRMDAAALVKSIEAQVMSITSLREHQKLIAAEVIGKGWRRMGFTKLRGGIQRLMCLKETYKKDGPPGSPEVLREYIARIPFQMGLETTGDNDE